MTVTVKTIVISGTAAVLLTVIDVVFLAAQFSTFAAEEAVQPSVLAKAIGSVHAVLSILAGIALLIFTATLLFWIAGFIKRRFTSNDERQSATNQ